MKRSKILGITLLGVLVAPLLPVQGQPIDSSKEAREMFKGYTDKINLAKLPPPKEIIGTLRELEAIAYELHVVVPFRVEQMLIHPDPAVRRQAARTLASIGANQFTAASRVDTLVRQMKDRDPEVLEAVLLALSFIGRNSQSGLPKALEVFKNDDPRVRRAAMAYFMVFLPENKDLMPTIIGALDDPDVGSDREKPGFNSVGMTAMSALQRYRKEAKVAAPRLARIVKRQELDEYYQFFALSTLTSIAPDEPLTVDAIREWLRQKDDAERVMTVCHVLSRLGPRAAPAIPDLVAILNRRSLADEAVDRRQKVSVLGVLTAVGPAAKEALPVLRRLKTSDDATIRLHATAAVLSVDRDK